MSPLIREALARLNEANAEAANVLELVCTGDSIANCTVIALAVDKCRVARFGLLEAQRDSFGKPKGLSPAQQKYERDAAMFDQILNDIDPLGQG